MNKNPSAPRDWLMASMDHALRALDPPAPRRVRTEPNPADTCIECGAEAIDTIVINGREVGVCGRHR